MSSHIFDFLLILPLAWGAFSGFKKGLLYSAATVIGLLIGIVTAYYFGDTISHFILRIFKFNNYWSLRVSCTLVFIIVFLSFILLAKVIEGMLTIAGLSIFNKLSGAIVGVLKWFIILGGIIFLFGQLEKIYPLIPPYLKKQSILYSRMERVVPQIISLIKKP